jgi:hypothetical protein
MISVLAVGLKVRGRGDGFLRAIKIRSTPLFRGEVKPDAPWHKIIRHVQKNRWEITKILRKAKLIFFAHSSCLLLDDCWYDCQRYLMDKSGVFSVDIILPWCSVVLEPNFVPQSTLTCPQTQFHISFLQRGPRSKQGLQLARQPVDARRCSRSVIFMCKV